MGLTTAYLVAAKNLPSFLEAVRTARAPERFTLKFVEDLGFKSTNDRLFIPLLKALGFVDDNGAPKQRYFDFLDDSQWQHVLADGIREAYEDLFRLNKKAHTLTRSDLAGKIKSLTQGKHSDTVVNNMTKTFTELAKLANFEKAPGEAQLPRHADGKTEQKQPPSDGGPKDEQPLQKHDEAPAAARRLPHGRLIDGLTYRIEIILPSNRDKAVYDAIFRSLKEHLL